MLAALAVFLFRYSHQEDILIGSPIANRSRREVEPLIGFFANVLILRTRLDRNPTFTELLEQVKKTALGAYAHQDIPFEKLIKDLNPERNLSYHPLFQIMFVFQNAVLNDLEMPGIKATPLRQEHISAKFDLGLSMADTPDGLVIEWEYNSDLFMVETIQRAIAHFRTLLRGIVARPECRVAKLPLLSEAEHHQLLTD